MMKYPHFRAALPVAAALLLAVTCSPLSRIAVVHAQDLNFVNRNLQQCAGDDDRAQECGGGGSQPKKCCDGFECGKNSKRCIKSKNKDEDEEKVEEKIKEKDEDEDKIETPALVSDSVRDGPFGNAGAPFPNQKDQTPKLPSQIDLDNCAVEGFRAHQCGADGNRQAKNCCPGFVCSDKNSQCVKDPGVTFDSSTCIQGYGCLQYVGEGKGKGRMGHCQGNCKDSKDCFGDESKCVNADDKDEEFERILRKFGCAGDVLPGVSYCVDSGKKLEGIDLLVFEQVSAPTTQPPTIAPTISPKPTSRPTTAAPTVSPMPTPTEYTLYPINEAPTDPDSDYFDYAVKGENGPDKWGKLRGGPNQREGLYWTEFSEYLDMYNSKNNMCASGSSRQSPIDVRHSNANAQCFEYHQIRHKDGDFGVTHPKVIKQILPSKLRLVYPRDKFTDGDQSFGDQNKGKAEFGPSADMPKRWGYQLPVTNVDIKIPSEHYMDGKQYEMEYQIFMIQNRLGKKRGVPIVSVLFDIDPNDEDNEHLEKLIQQFERVNEKDMQACEATERRQRRLNAKLFDALANDEQKEKLGTWLDEPAENEIKFQSKLRATQRRVEEEKHRKWDPWNESIVRSVWFYGYPGSLTEPPCSEFVEWRIMLEPAYLSTRQLARLKNVLFNHVDRNCQRTSVHSQENGVARPIQPYNGHELYVCTCMDYMSDESKDDKEKRCRFRDRGEYGFDEDVYTYEWYTGTQKWDSIEEMWANTGNGKEPWWAR